MSVDFHESAKISEISYDRYFTPTSDEGVAAIGIAAEALLKICNRYREAEDDVPPYAKPVNGAVIIETNNIQSVTALFDNELSLITDEVRNSQIDREAFEDKMVRTPIYFRWLYERRVSRYEAVNMHINQLIKDYVEINNLWTAFESTANESKLRRHQRRTQTV